MNTISLVDFSRYEAQQGKQKEIAWSDACSLFANPKVLSEVKSDEINSRKKELESDKHKAGFVFWGRTENGRKRKQDIINHSAVALDYDDIKTNKETFLQNLENALNGFNYMYYSTTKCTEKDLRLRVIIPLSASISGDKYQAVGRALITMIGTDGVDKSTLQDNRAMGYTAKLADAEYIYKAVTDSEFLNVEKFLFEEYTDWQDVSEWFKFPDEKEKVKSASRRASKEANGGKVIVADEYVDAANRTGIEGAFCRTFTIAETIEKYLSDVYVPTSDGRYTYTGGASTGGLVVFGENGGRAVYSHHSTDPAHGKVLNAFQLVQIHRYGNLDTGTYIYESKKPSYQQMKKFAMEIPEVIREMNGVKTPERNANTALLTVEQQFADTIEFPANDNGIARAMSVIYESKYRWAEDAGTWLEFDGMRWVEIPETRLIGAFNKLARIYQRMAMESSDADLIQHASKCVGYCQQYRYQKDALKQLKDMIRVRMGDMDADDWLINTKTGVIDLKALEEGREWFLPHDPKYNLMKVAGAGIDDNFVHDEECEKFINDLFPDEQVREYAQMAVGYALSGSTAEKKMFLFWGEKGNNGKTAFCNLWRNMMGDYATTAEDKMILTSKNDGNSEAPSPFLASLRGSRFAYVEEIAAGRKLDSATVKRVTGNAVIKCRKMKQNTIEYLPKFKLVVCCNDMPTLQSNETAMQTRVRVIPFDNYFSAKKGNLDSTINEKIQTEAWKNTFLDWALMGYAKWKEKGNLDNFTGDMSVFESDLPKRIKMVLANYFDNGDDIGDFIQTYIDVTGNEKDFISTSDLYDVFVKESKSQYGVNARVFKINLARAMQEYKADGVTACRKRIQDANGLVSNARGFSGIKWMDTMSEFHDDNIDEWEMAMASATKAS